ncbi:uncharacterized protein LOC101850542 [Aplysia californica]|uniref:Uncharacterized protein LOC101850542 n=1 Tax=Aplysia californica TaxID=6500 RepID=A0ABM0JG59_APLCA|nr:uncharacterized protein LOC101850542 [Aplysia californica]
MGNQKSTQPLLQETSIQKGSARESSRVPSAVLQGEVATLNQGIHCEMALLPCDDVINEGVCDIMYRRCKKNPGHLLFTPVAELTLEDLPVESRHPNILVQIKQLAFSVVRLRTNYTSTHRPDRFGLPSLKGTRKLRFGSGCILSNLSELSVSKESKLVVEISTAAHVVFDDDEAKSTRVECFLQSDTDFTSVANGKGVRIVHVNVDHDFCIFECEFAQSKQLLQFCSSVKKAKEDCKTNIWPFVNNPLTFSISHPHGTAQRISFGSQLQRNSLIASEVTVNVMKIFSSRVWQKLHVDLKKIWHFIVCELCLKDFQLPLSSTLKGKDLASIVAHLVSKELITHPLETESEQLKGIYKALVKEIAKVIVLRLVSGQGSTCNVDKKKVRQTASYEAMRAEIVSEMASRVHLVPDFEGTLERIHFAITSETVKEITGLHLPATFCLLRGMDYAVPTCPGSSGAPVFTVNTREMAMVNHSRAREKLGSGGVGLFVKFTK